jgi:hypothetical protein
VLNQAYQAMVLHSAVDLFATSAAARQR